MISVMGRSAMRLRPPAHAGEASWRAARIAEVVADAVLIYSTNGRRPGSGFPSLSKRDAVGSHSLSRSFSSSKSCRLRLRCRLVLANPRKCPRSILEGRFWG